MARAFGLAGADREDFCRCAFERTPERVRPGEPAVVPAQLPAGVNGFVGRTQALRQLDSLLSRPAPDTAAPAVVVLSGMAGIGKTTLALHWAHRVRDQFPDGQLYLNLRGFHPAGRPVPPAEALGAILNALDAPSARMSPELQARSGLYRTLSVGRRMLVVLDNARDADQIRPLLPGSSSCLVLVTSRDPLVGLVSAHGALPMPLPLLSPAEAQALLTRRLGRDRSADPADAVRRILARCAGLPLALTIVAGRAATDDSLSLDGVARQLESAGALDALATGDASTDFRGMCSCSYRLLPPSAASLFRLLALVPGPEIRETAVASMLGVAQSRARMLLNQLCRAYLISRAAQGRYSMHGLVRAYAAELLLHDGGGAAPGSAVPTDRGQATPPIERRQPRSPSIAAQGS